MMSPQQTGSCVHSRHVSRLSIYQSVEYNHFSRILAVIDTRNTVSMNCLSYTMKPIILSNYFFRNVEYIFRAALLNEKYHYTY